MSSVSLSGTGVPHYIGPTGGVSLSPTQPLPHPADLAPDGAVGTGVSASNIPDDMVPNFFDAALYGGMVANSGGLSGFGPASASTSAATSSATLGSQSAVNQLPLHNWEGILSQQQNPYGGGVAAPGIIASDYFNPYIGFHGATGPFAFAAEATAFLGNEGTNWQDSLNVGYVRYRISHTANNV